MPRAPCSRRHWHLVNTISDLLFHTIKLRTAEKLGRHNVSDKKVSTTKCHRLFSFSIIFHLSRLENRRVAQSWEHAQTVPYPTVFITAVMEIIRGKIL